MFSQMRPHQPILLPEQLNEMIKVMIVRIDLQKIIPLLKPVVPQEHVSALQALELREKKIILLHLERLLSDRTARQRARPRATHITRVSEPVRERGRKILVKIDIDPPGARFSRKAEASGGKMSSQKLE